MKNEKKDQLFSGESLNPVIQKILIQTATEEQSNNDPFPFCV